MNEKDGTVRTLCKKVCLLGDFAVGKTSLVRRFVYDLFDDQYLGGVGVKVSHKAVAVPGSGATLELTIMFWDLANSNEFESNRVSFLRGAAGAVAVCDVTRPSTFGGLYQYSRDVRAIHPGVHLILAANKSDLADRRSVTEAQLEMAALAINAPFYLTSARTGANVGDLFRHLAQMLVADTGLKTVGQISHDSQGWAGNALNAAR
jgi:small GTP-binding protein